MYFIWDFTQLNVRPHSRVGLLKYKTAPIRHSGVGRNPRGPTPSFRRRPESRRAPIPSFRRRPESRRAPIPSFRRRPESKRAPIPSFRRRPESRRAPIPSFRRRPESRRAPIPSFRRRPESRRAHSVIPAQAGIQAGPFRHSSAGRNPGGPIPSFRRRPESRRAPIPSFRRRPESRRAPIPSFRRRPESRRAHSVIPAQAGIQGRWGRFVAIISILHTLVSRMGGDWSERRSRYPSRPNLPSWRTDS